MDDEGRSRLACKAKNSAFDVDGRKVDRGVVSYYAASTLTEAETVSDWAARINAAIRRDRKADKLPASLWVQVRVAGNAAIDLLGERPRR